MEREPPVRERPPLRHPPVRERSLLAAASLHGGDRRASCAYPQSVGHASSSATNFGAHLGRGELTPFVSDVCVPFEGSSARRGVRRSGDFPGTAPARPACLSWNARKARASGRRLLVLATLTAWLTPLAATEVYKWTDDAGHVHFGDKPPASPAERVTIRSAPAPAATSPQQDRLHQMLDDYARERQTRETHEAERAYAEAIQERRCTVAKRRRHAAEHANFLYDYDAAGERRVLDGADYDAALAKLRADMEAACATPP